jgi:hypothetical protein
MSSQMGIIFLPIDIDLSALKFYRDPIARKTSNWKDVWDGSFISDDHIKNTGLDQILSQLPYTKITRILFNPQLNSVLSHTDKEPDNAYEEGEYSHATGVEPCGYRIVLKGRKDSLSFYNGKEWITPELPSIPCCYVLDSTSAYHKVATDVGREVIWLRGFVDPKKHQDLINRSLQKYKPLMSVS